MHFKAILFDLDGTLLNSSMETFLPAYLKLLSARLAHLVPPDEFVPELLRATDAMVANDGRATNEEVFAAAFYPLAGHDRQELEPIFRDFYARDFPALSALTTPKTGARPAVERAFALGYDVVIATNPLFPETAVRQRMAWAGVDGLPYSLVTTYENSRYAKPNPAYFAAIASYLGHEPAACLVVGDEHMDMVAAYAGCPTFLVPGEATKLRDDTPAPTYRGTLSEVVALIAAGRG